MKNLRCYLILAVVISMLIISLSGCAVGIKKRSNDMPPEDDVYYEESPYDSYDTGRRSSGSHYYDPGYDPWTMGTYYQHYSGPPRSSASSGSSDKSSVRSESKRPTMKDRNSSSASQSKAPTTSSDSNSKRSGTSLRERRKTNSQISDSALRKVRRAASSASRESRSSSTIRKKRSETNTQQNSQKAQPRKTRSTTEEEDEKDKKRKSPR